MLLELKNIKKYFSIKKGLLGKTTSYVKAVDGIDLAVQNKENISLVGESGCGKTTLARMAMKLLPSDSGSIIFQGQDLVKLSNHQLKHYRKNMQIVFQDPYSSLDPRFTVRRIMEEAMTLDRDRYGSKKAKEKRIDELFTAVGLGGDILERYPHEFSGGERQRIAIARALVLNPKLLILDEAVSSLDVLIQSQIINLLKDLQNKFDLTYLFISHNLKVVKKLSHKIAVMYKGKIVETASTQELFLNPLHPYTQELLTAAIEYRSASRDKEIEINPQGKLVDRGNNHFVLSD